MSQRSEGTQQKITFFNPHIFVLKKHQKNCSNGKKKNNWITFHRKEMFLGKPLASFGGCSIWTAISRNWARLFFSLLLRQKKYNGKRKCDIFPFPPFRKQGRRKNVWNWMRHILFCKKERGRHVLCFFGEKGRKKKKKAPFALQIFFPSLCLVYGNLPEGTHAFLILCCSLSPHCLQRNERKKFQNHRRCLPKQKKTAKTGIIIA